MQNYYLANKIFFYALGIITFLALFYFFFFNAPKSFPIEDIIKIELGMNLGDVSSKLKQENIIKSRIAFEAFVIMYGGEKHIIVADYVFENKLPVYEVARRISKGEHHMAPVSVTIPEGFDISQIADTFVEKLSNFNRDKFIILAKGKEGYLFPDTYFFLSTDNEVDVIHSMRENFEKKIAELRSKILNMGKKEKEVIIMASLIEGEAKGDVDRGVISGILWRRLLIGMPLQVDVALETYKVKGLPKSPIGNPGLEAITAAIYPRKSPYLYYLHDKEGNIHYAKSFAEHNANIKKYLSAQGGPISGWEIKS